MVAIMVNWWPFGARKKRIEEGWQKVRMAVEAGRAEHKAVLEIAEKLAKNEPKRQAYTTVLEEFMNRKRGLHEHLPPTG